MDRDLASPSSNKPARLHPKLPWLFRGVTIAAAAIALCAGTGAVLGASHPAFQPQLNPHLTVVCPADQEMVRGHCHCKHGLVLLGGKCMPCPVGTDKWFNLCIHKCPPGMVHVVPVGECKLQIRPPLQHLKPIQ